MPTAGSRGERLDAALGFGGELQTVTADEFEKPEQQRRILQGRKLAQENAALYDRKIGIRQTRFAIFK